MAYEFPALGCFKSILTGCLLFLAGGVVLFPLAAGAAGALLDTPWLRQFSPSDQSVMGFAFVACCYFLLFLTITGRMGTISGHRPRLEVTLDWVTFIGADAYTMNPLNAGRISRRRVERHLVKSFSLRSMRPGRGGVRQDHLQADLSNGKSYLLLPLPWTTPTLAQDLCDDLNHELSSRAER